MKYSVGIDLGTTFSSVAVVDETQCPQILPSRQRNNSIPSVIYFGNDLPLVGDVAKERQALGETEVASFFKRNMGDPSFVLNFGGREYNSTDLSALLLGELKRETEISLGMEVEQAVITVPAYFNHFQREATLQAGQMAGFNVLRIINEPTAAALTYGLFQKTPCQTVLVYDLGGGTFDVTLVQITASQLEVLATNGDHELGGKDWDDRIATYLEQQFLAKHPHDSLEKSIMLNELLIRCEQAKKQLSQRIQTQISLNHAGNKEIYSVTRSQFVQITQDLMERTQLLTEQVLREAGLSWQQLDGVLLVGGSTRMPMVGQYIQMMSGKPPLTGVNADEAVALGAAIQANLDAEVLNEVPFTLKAKKTIQDVMSHSLGMIAENEDRSRYLNSIIIPKNKPIPRLESRPFQLRTTQDQTNQLDVYILQGESEEPSQCVILGQYTFSNITHIPNKPAIIDIEYAYDKNGVVTVSAIERATQHQLPKQAQIPTDLSWLALPPSLKVQKAEHLAVFLLIDVSYSMDGSPLQEAKQAAKAFVHQSDLAHLSIGLIKFGSQAQIISELTQNTKQINQAISQLKTDGSTNMADGLKQAYLKLQLLKGPRFIILLTDGIPDKPRQAMQEAQKICAAGIQLITIGTGDADKKYLQKMAGANNQSIFVTAGAIIPTFSRIAQVLTESGGDIRYPLSVI